MHQCVHCGTLYPDGSKELLEGCSKCKSHFFFYIKDEYFRKLEEEKKLPFQQINEKERENIEKDIRDIIGIKEEEPVILEIESIRVIKKGKFELDLTKILKKNLPIIYKIEEGKYIIDLSNLNQANIKAKKQVKKIIFIYL
ncbi:MAG: Zn-ribbon containing protein [Candidatus Pacearchaeota archaeon]